MRTWKLASIVAFGCLFVGMNASPARADGANAADDAAAQPRVEAESIFYARLGYGAIFTAQTQGVPSVGLVGYRHELDAFAVDMSFLNFAFANGSSPYVGSSSNASSGSWLKLEALRFARPRANASGYAGGGLSWGSTNVENKSEYSSGSGLQGELTVGYETARNSSIRAFYPGRRHAALLRAGIDGLLIRVLERDRPQSRDCFDVEPQVLADADDLDGAWFQASVAVLTWAPETAAARSPAADSDPD